jgi:sulfatase modifying factor 1
MRACTRAVVVFATLMTVFFTTSSFAQLVNYELVPIGDPGNAPDTTGYGAVNYEYQIGKYEVTIGQYAAFLNAVAKTDPYGLWNGGMSPDLDWSTGGHRTGIQREGVSGSFSYSPVGPSGETYGQSTSERPISFLNWFTSARFANWMANGQPTGPQGPSTTENGAYFVNGAIDGFTVPRNAVNPNTNNPPTFWIPNENEWYKAAYFDPSTGGGTYWTYATRSDQTPGNQVGGAVNQANFRRINVYSVSQQATTVSGQNYLSDVGSFTNSSSFYGTFDQTGNVIENLDPDAYATDIFYMGGSWQDNDGFPGASNRLTKFWRGGDGASSTGNAAGLRLAAVPEPATCIMALAGLACGGYLRFRGRKRA